MPHRSGKLTTVRQFQALWLLVLASAAAAAVADLTLDEDRPEGTQLPQLDRVLQDAGILTGSFMMVNHPYFEYNKAKGTVTVKKKLDRDTMCKNDGFCCEHLRNCILTLKFIDNQAIPFNTKVFQVTVRDLNDHSPEFEQPLRIYYIREDTPPGHMERLPLAKDPDAEENSVVAYELKPESVYFALKPDTGSRRTSKLFLDLLTNLDREQQAVHEFNLIAVDGSGRNGTMRIVVHVNDSNDCYPYFATSQVTVRVRESQKSGCIAQVTAKDEDEGINAEIVYELDTKQVGQGDLAAIQANFRIDRSTGRVCLNRRLDYEEKSEYELNIVARNVVPYTRHDRPATATVTILVEDENDEKPVLRVQYLGGGSSSEQQRFSSVLENQREGRPVALLIATDRDSGLNGRVKCELKRATDRELFQLLMAVPGYPDPVAKTEYYFGTKDGIGLDREAMLGLVPPERANAFEVMHLVEIICRDSGQPQNSVVGNLTVRVLDVNDNDPQLSVHTWPGRGGHATSDIVEVEENVPANARITRVVAIDPDYGDNGTVGFSMEGSPLNTQETFAILSDGVLVTKKLLDREESNPPVDAFSVVVVGTDKGSPPRSSTISFQIRLTDQNDNPPHMDPQITFRVPENNKPQLQIGQIEVSDPDRVGRLSLTLQPGRLPFKIHEEHQRFFLVATETLDSELVKEYNFQVIATDDTTGRGHRTVSRVTVLVQDQNDHAPQIFYPCDKAHRNDRNHTVSWREAQGYTIVKVNAKDDDQDKTTNGKFHFSLTPASRLFVIDAESGEVKVGVHMQQTDIGAHRLSVTVTDSGLPKSLSATCDFFIIVDRSEPRVDDRRITGRTPLAEKNPNGSGLLPGYNLSDATILIAVAALICLLLISILLLLCYARHWHNTPEFLPDLLLLCLSPGGRAKPCATDDPDLAVATAAAVAGRDGDAKVGRCDRLPSQTMRQPVYQTAVIRAGVYDCGSDFYQMKSSDRRLYEHQLQLQQHQQQHQPPQLQQSYKTVGAARHLYQTLQQQPQQPPSGLHRRSMHKSDSDLVALGDAGPGIRQQKQPYENMEQQRDQPQQQREPLLPGGGGPQATSRSMHTLMRGAGQHQENPLKPFPAVQASYV